MSKHKKIVSTIIAISIVVVLNYLVGSLLQNGQTVECSTGRDTYRAFGDGRFQASSPGDDMQIRDLDNSNFVISTVEKYIFQDDLLFITGYYVIGDLKSVLEYNDFTSHYPDGGISRYESLDEIPYYTVVDIGTGEAEFFLTYNDLPKEYKSVFDEPTNWWCELFRTCWEKE